MTAPAVISGSTGPDSPEPDAADAAVDAADDGGESAVSEADLQKMIAAEVTRQLASVDRDPLGGLLDPSTTPVKDEQWSFGSSALDMVGAGARRLWGLALGVVELGLLVFLVPFYFFFFAVSYPKVLRFARDLVPSEHRDEVFRLVTAMDRAVSGFVRGRLVISAIEHPAVRRAAEARAAEGWEVAIAPVDRSGRVALGPLRILLRERDAVCCVIGANNVTGVVQPIEPIADLCAARGVPLHVDHVQTAAGAPLDIGQLPGEVTAAIAAHKLGGPRGVGALLGPGVGSLAPVVHGGGQERGLRPGTEDGAGAIALATALERRQGLGAPAEWGARAALRDRLETALSLPVAGADGERLPGHSLLLTGLRGDTLVRLLDERGIAVAAGSACASGATEPDPVLTAMGVDDRTARTAVRVSLGPETTTADVDALIEAWREIAPALQAAVEASA